MAITKDQWALIEKELAGYFGRVTLSLDGRELKLVKEFYKENQLCIVVYIDGKWHPSWGMTRSEKFDPFVMRVWCEVKRRLYPRKAKADLEKKLGKRASKKYFPDLDKTSSFWAPCFMTFRTMKGVLNKEKGLELVRIGYAVATTTATPEGVTTNDSAAV